MFSYRHAYHAGNFADLLKHLVLCHLLAYLKRKPSPIRYIDTHAGAGCYDLQAAASRQTGEFNRGVGLMNPLELPASYGIFHQAIAPFLAQRQYPGSPLIAARLLREQDELRLYELHNTDFPALSALFRGDRRVRVFHESGYHALKSQLPVRNARALVLMDPPYELQSEYNDVVAGLEEGYRRMPHAVFALWYPVLDQSALSYLMRHLRALAGADLWQVELDNGDQRGMHRCGMLVINPPFGLPAQLAPLLEAIRLRLVTGRGES